MTLPDNTTVSRVGQIYLNSNGLSGTLTVELGGLVFLDTLDLGGNAITGLIPPGIWYELEHGGLIIFLFNNLFVLWWIKYYKFRITKIAWHGPGLQYYIHVYFLYE